MEHGDAADEGEAWKLAGRLMAGAHMQKLDGLVPLPDDRQLGRARVVDWLAGRPHVLEDLRRVSRETLAAAPDHLQAVEGLIDQVAR